MSRKLSEEELLAKAISETDRRRDMQIEYNKKHNITPKTINKTISDILYNRGIKTKKEVRADFKVSEQKKRFSEYKLLDMDPSKAAAIISGLEEEMYLEARELNFEKAVAIRDEIKRIKKITNIEVER